MKWESNNLLWFRNIYYVLTTYKCGGISGQTVSDSTWDPQAVDNKWKMMDIDPF